MIYLALILLTSAPHFELPFEHQCHGGVVDPDVTFGERALEPRPDPWTVQTPWPLGPNAYPSIIMSCDLFGATYRPGQLWGWWPDAKAVLP